MLRVFGYNVSFAKIGITAHHDACNTKYSDPLKFNHLLKKLVIFWLPLSLLITFLGLVVLLVVALLIFGFAGDGTLLGLVTVFGIFADGSSAIVSSGSRLIPCLESSPVIGVDGLS